MNEIIKSALSFFDKRINILIIDDDETILFAHKQILTSPLFAITQCTNLNDAKNKIRSAKQPFCCWLIDVNLGPGQNGLDLLTEFPFYPFAIVLSGMRSLLLGSEAMKLGAMSVFDKECENIDKIYEDICKVSALGYMLGDKSAKHVKVFKPLKDKGILPIAEWADKNFISIRQLERICSNYSDLSPRYAIALYNTVYYLLWHPIADSEVQSSLDENLDFYLSCMEIVLTSKGNITSSLDI